MDTVVPKQRDIRQSCTILLPLFNGSKFLSQSLNNLCEIAGPTDEILVLDDGSTDLTIQEIESLGRLDSRIVFHNFEHRGLVNTLNEGIKLAKNEFIARADVDDIYAKNRIEIQVNYLIANPETSAVFNDYKMVSSSGTNLGIFPSAISTELTAFSLLCSQRTPHPSVMYRKSAVVAAGCYMPEDFPAEDLALWIRLVGEGKIASIPFVLLNYTVHRASITQTNQKLMREKSNALRQQYAWSINAKDLFNKSAKLLDEYKENSLRDLRILFFFEELLKYDRLTNGIYRQEITSILFRQILKRNFFLVPPALYAIFMKLKRKSFTSK